MREDTRTFETYQTPPFPSIVRFNAAGIRVTEDGRDAIAMAVIQFWGGPAVDIEIKSSFSPWTVVKFTVNDWNDTEGRSDEQRLAFLGELIRRLLEASNDGSGVLLPDIKAEIVKAVLAEHWTRQPLESTRK